RNKQDSLVRPALPFIEVDLFGVEVAEVDALATFSRNLRGQRDFDARSLDSLLGVVSPDASQVRAVRDDAPGMMFEPVPLFHEIVAHMLTDLFQNAPVRLAYLINVRGVDDPLAAFFNRGFELVHSLRRRPYVVVHPWHHRKNALERALDPFDVNLRREADGLFISLFGRADV